MKKWEWKHGNGNTGIWQINLVEIDGLYLFHRLLQVLLCVQHLVGGYVTAGRGERRRGEEGEEGEEEGGSYTIMLLWIIKFSLPSFALGGSMD